MFRRRLWFMLPKQLRELPADLAAVLAVVVLTNLVVFVPGINDSPIRVIVGLGFVLFVPGYAFIAALFPEAGASPVEESDINDGSDETESPLRDRGIDGIERVALSFGLSIAIVPLIGLALNFTSFGIRLVPILASVSGFTVIVTAIAASRRWELPEEKRFRVPYRGWMASARSEIFEPSSGVDAALNVALVIVVVLALSSVVYAIAVPPQGEQFTEFYILTEDSDGELVAADYPQNFTVDESETLHVGIGNNEYETKDYTVVVQLQRVEVETNESQVIERTDVERWSATVAHNETRLEPRNITVSDEITGTDLRLTFLLYDGDVPAEPTRANAYRTLHLWITVEDPATR
jgi:uncharacterized membrane protein